MALGVVFAAQWPLLPDAAVVAFLPFCMLTAWLWAPVRPVALFACGFLWAVLRAQYLLHAVLPESLEGQTLVVHGQIASLPKVDARRLRFEFLISETRQGVQSLAFQGRVRLGWYQGAPPVAPGQHWRLVVRLKRPRGLVNPGGFDYERWLFRRGIAATGYVLSDAENRLVGPVPAIGLTGLRHRLARAHLDIRGGQVDRMPSHLGHPGLEADPGAQARFFEDHRQRPTCQHVGESCRLRFDLRCEAQDVFEPSRLDIMNREEVIGHRRRF